MAYLKRLTLKNFKSFRTTNIPFAPGFTAIMGPNGSGKSNIIDALIFVLGEARLKLVRASRLKDLVNVKAKDGEAIVSLDIEADGKVYNVTRTINRKGQSVYRINGKRATRHEVVSLLSSLGISQRGYNFVLQGEITRLLRMSPQERRQIIEEIAGIAEYEEKKEEAMRKLEDVSQRIREVSILLGEREEQLKRLRKEKEDAERYLKLKRFANSLRRAMLEERLRRAEEEMVRLEREVGELEKRKSELEERRRALEDELVRLEGREKELSERMAELYRESSGGAYVEVMGELERVKGELEHAEEKLDELLKEKEMLTQRLEELRVAMRKKREEAEEVSRRRLEKDKEVNELRRRLSAVEDVITREQEETRAIQIKLAEVEQRIEALKAEYMALKEEYGRVVGEYNARVEQAKRRRELLEKRRREAEVALRQIDSELSELRKKKEELLERERTLNSLYLSLQDEIKAIREELGAVRGASLVLQNLGISLDVLRALEEAQRKGELRGIKGYVASLISYDKRYRRAIEAAAGRRLFYIVVETAEDAAEAIKYLKRNALGRATFIPLDKIRPAHVEVPQIEGVIGRAIDLVTFDPSLRRAMEYVFGDTLVVRDIDVAKRLERVRAVTLDGDVVERSGVMSGGHVKGESVLKLFEAEKKREELKKKEEELKEITGSLQQIRRELEKLNERISRLEKERERLTAKLDIEEAEEDLSKLKERVDNLRERLTALASQLSDLEAERSRYMAQLKKADSGLFQQLTQLRREYEAKMNELSEYTSLYREKLREIEGLEKEIARIEGRLAQIEEEIARTEELSRVLKGRAEELRRKAEALEREAEKKREELEAVRRELEVVEEEVKRRAKELGQINRQIDEIERRLLVNAEKRASLQSTISSLREEVASIEEEPLKELPPEPEKELRRALEEMRSLEPVNLKAIEEYEEMRAKVEEVKAKIEQLEREKRAVLDLINEIEKKKRDVFMETFRAIAAKFEEVYRDLTGGKARLSLTSDDVFSAGLLIEATPKGKTLTNIDALSGGEKAMVALAFIFATALYRPAPFYVLDEPDLMLDKVNAERMAKFIKRLSHSAQFIVVSHRDVVLKEADQIIGVYLGPDGSSLVEVKVPKASQISS